MIPRKIHFVAATCWLLSLVACADSANWRDIQLAAVALELQLPCKPETRSQNLPLLTGGKQLRVSMTGCELNGVTYAVATAQVPVGEEATAVLARWQQAMPSSDKVQRKVLHQGQAVVLASVLQIDGKADSTISSNFFTSLRWK